MIEGVRGRLISTTFAETVLPTLRRGSDHPHHAFHDALDAWAERCQRSVGPASSARAIADVVATPLLRLLGFDVTGRQEAPEHAVLVAASGTTALPVVVVPWGQPLDRVWRTLVHAGVGLDSPWCLCCNGIALRIVDTTRVWSRHYLEFDLALLPREEPSARLLWNVVSAQSMSGQPAFLDEAVTLSANYGTALCGALGRGVLQALGMIFGALSKGRHREDPSVLFDQSVIVLYRVLFLLFAEARGLVPIWHPVYRDRYSLDAIVHTLLAGRRARGVWRALQAISRLAHGGCAAGQLRVTAFNGRLFSPAHAGAVERARLDDGVIGDALLAMSTTALDGTSRQRIAYRDLDVEQLGAVYEQVLEYQPGRAGTTILDRSRDTRKATATFYTPRAITAYLVRQTLEPLVRDRRADEILNLRLLDPAMGSGAFLVAACRYLAVAVEEAFVREGRWHPGDVSAADRAALRREIAQRCLFGADVNPMAVQLARLSLWLATLAADRPLTFLDHHLVVGDSLVGATLDDVRRQPPGTGRAARTARPLPLFEDYGLVDVLQHAVRTRVQLTREPDDSAAIVRAKEKALAALHDTGSRLGRLQRVLDLWCAVWFWPQDTPSRGVFAALCARLLHDETILPDSSLEPLLRCAADLASEMRFLHWTLTFPEVFAGEDGATPDAPGFDAVLGNPPWDMVRGDSGDRAVRATRRDHARHLTRFVRDSGIYRVEAGAHINRYQLFVERALQLVKPGGRIGLVVPSGLAIDTGAAGLRRHLFTHASIEALTGLDNRGGIFPIHRGVRFLLLSCTARGQTSELACRFGISTPDDLFRPDVRAPLVITRRLIHRVSGDHDLGIPELASERDLAILEQLSARHPWLGSRDGWHVQFGRELNASDDRDSLVPFSGSPHARPVLEGKHIEPFRVQVDRCRLQLSDRTTKRIAWRARLAYRDVASATNRLTLIAAVVPARAVTTHTLFCLKTPMAPGQQHALSAVLNSLVANYLIRMRVNTHVSTALVSRLPAPVFEREARNWQELARLSQQLGQSRAPVESERGYAELQARVAQLYGLSAADFDHILQTFPLIPAAVREDVRSRFIAPAGTR